MNEFSRLPALLLAAGALGVAAATALEVITAPYSPQVSAYWLNPAVHLLKIVAVLELEAVFAQHSWIGGLAMLAMVAILVAAIALAVVVLRRGLLPRWAPIVSLVSLLAAVAAAVLNGLGLRVPHPPTWIFLGIAAYGIAWASAAPDVVAEPQEAEPLYQI